VEIIALGVLADQALNARENVGDQGIDVNVRRECDAKHRLGEGTEEVRESPRECSRITRGPIAAEGAIVFAKACELGLEGIVSTR
jgi:hypothetical protein